MLQHRQNFWKFYLYFYLKKGICTIYAILITEIYGNYFYHQDNGICTKHVKFLSCYLLRRSTSILSGLSLYSLHFKQLKFWCKAHIVEAYYVFFVF